MHSRKTKRRSCRTGPQSLHLESLDRRLLLDAACDWLPCQNQDNINHSEYGIPDPYFSDPFYWSGTNDESVYGPPSPVSHDSILQSIEELEESILQKYFDSLPDTALLQEASLSDTSAEPAAAGGAYTLYLDFDGAVVSSRAGDFWLGSNSVQIPAFSLSQYGWGGREQEAIHHIVEFVQEDYAAYNVQIVTQKPVSGEYTTMYIGGTNDWFMPNSGVIGVATYDILNQDASNYGFAFTEELGIYHTYSSGNLLYFSEYIANLVSHEAAHTFGSNHVDNTTALMNPYLPINPRTSMFGSGTIPGTSTFQNTQQQLGTNLGYAHGADDHGNTFAAASSITSISMQGMLEKRDDVDVFRFTATQTGNAIIDIDTSAYGNLDSYLTVTRSSDLAQVAANDDFGSDLDSQLTFQTIAGESYYLSISSSSQNSSGSYILNLQTQIPDPQPQIAISDNNGSFTDQTIDFGSVMVLTQAAAGITIANTGSANLVLSQITAGTDFSLNVINLASSSADDITIAPGNQYTFGVTFFPSQTGSYSSQVTIVSNDSETPISTVTLSGNAHEPQAELSVFSNGQNVSGIELDLGSVIRNIPSTDTIQIQNTGQDDLLLYGVQFTGPFSLVNGPSFSGGGVSLAPGQTLNLSIQSLGLQRGNITGQMTLISNDPDNPYTIIPLSADVLGGVLTIEETSGIAHDNKLEFGPVPVGQTKTQNILLINTGDANLTLRGIESPTGFTLSTLLDPDNSADDIILAPGQSLSIDASITPPDMAYLSGAILILTDNTESPQDSVSLTAQGVAGILEITELDGNADGQTDWGSIQTGQSSLENIWQVQNSGNFPLTIHLALQEGTDFQLAQSSTLILQPGQSRILSVNFLTQQAQTITDTLLLTSDSVNLGQEHLVLVAHAYALVGNGQKYSFADQSGDLVTVSLSGQAQAKIITGDEGTPDIQSIDILSSNGTETLSITVKNGGRTLIGQITGSSDLKSIKAPSADLVGDGIHLDGNLNQLKVGHVLSGADIYFHAQEPATLQMEKVIGDSQLKITGPVDSFQAMDFLGSAWTSFSLNKAKIAGECSGQFQITAGNLGLFTIHEGSFSGNLHVAGSLGKLNIAKGNLQGIIQTDTAIDKILLGEGTLSGTIQAGDGIGTIKTWDMDQADITVQNQILAIRVRNNMSSSLVSIGSSANSSKTIGSQNVDASICQAFLGTLKVTGTYSASTVAVGVAPDSQGNYISGTSSADHAIIKNVQIQQVLSENNNSPFGVCTASAIQKMKLNNQKITSEFQQDDFYVTILNH